MHDEGNFSRMLVQLAAVETAARMTDAQCGMVTAHVSFTFGCRDGVEFVPIGYNSGMSALSTRILIFVIIAWTNIYCCCATSARPAPPEQAKPDCCAHKQSSSKSSEHWPADNRECEDCQFLEIRQNTLIETAHRVVEAPTICPFIDALVPSLRAPLYAPMRRIDWNDPIKIPKSLLDLHTCLLR